MSSHVLKGHNDLDDEDRPGKDTAEGLEDLAEIDSAAIRAAILSSTGVSSMSSPFQSSSSATILATGNAAFDHDLMEAMEYFDCQVDTPYEDEQGKLYSVLMKLPCYGPLGRSRDFCYMRATVRPRGDRYNAQYSIEKKSMGMEPIKEQDLMTILRKSYDRSCRTFSVNRHSQHNQRFKDLVDKSSSPSIISFIDSFYYLLEEYWHPEKTVIVRDFCYSVYDPRHWGRPLPSLLDRLNADGKNIMGSSIMMLQNHGTYKATAKFDFQAATPEELSIKKGEKLYVLADFGNGWVSVRKMSPNGNNHNNNNNNSGESSRDKAVDVNKDNSRETQTTGLVPEYYVQRSTY